MKIKKGDTIEIITGKDSGKRGKIIRIDKARNRVVVEGANIVTKHVKARRAGTNGERIQFPGTIDASNVMLVCPHTDKPTRIGYSSSGKNKVRISKKSGKEI